MLDIIKKQLDQRASREEQANQTREFLQMLILKIIYDLGYFKYLVFTGGTALRIIYGLQRYSEDLDFSLVHKKGYSFKHFFEELIKQLTQNYGFKVSHKARDQKTVHAVDLKFDDLLFDLGLSSHRPQKLYIKIEIDSNPPQGGITAISLVSRSFVFPVTHFDLPSLFATKLHACFFRRYTKGRDVYDLIWYLGKDLLPNFENLNHAIKQTQKESAIVTPQNFKEILLKHIDEIDFAAAQRDVERFLIDKSELRLFNRDILKKAVESKFL